MPQLTIGVNSKIKRGNSGGRQGKGKGSHAPGLLCRYSLDRANPLPLARSDLVEHGEGVVRWGDALGSVERLAFFPKMPVDFQRVPGTRRATLSGQLGQRCIETRRRWGAEVTA